MSLQVQGKIIKTLPLQSGQGKNGEWKKQEYILETQSNYPKKVCLSVWGEKIDQFKLREGENVMASIEIESREYNNRWYTEVKIWKLDRPSGQGAEENFQDFIPPDEFAPGSPTDDLPF